MLFQNQLRWQFLLLFKSNTPFCPSFEPYSTCWSWVWFSEIKEKATKGTFCTVYLDNCIIVNMCQGENRDLKMGSAEQLRSGIMLIIIMMTTMILIMMMTIEAEGAERNATSERLVMQLEVETANIFKCTETNYGHLTFCQNWLAGSSNLQIYANGNK